MPGTPGLITQILTTLGLGSDYTPRSPGPHGPRNARVRPVPTGDVPDAGGELQDALLPQRQLSHHAYLQVFSPGFPLQALEQQSASTVHDAPL